MYYFFLISILTVQTYFLLTHANYVSRREGRFIAIVIFPNFIMFQNNPAPKRSDLPNFPDRTSSSRQQVAHSLTPRSA